MSDLWKVAVLDGGSGKFIVRHVRLSFGTAKATADWYSRCGVAARASLHDGRLGYYYYGRSR